MDEVVLPPLTRGTLASQVYQVIVRYILRTGAEEGSRLPSERRFSDMLEVSRTVVREALDLLAEEGYVEKRVGAGVILRKRPPSLDLENGFGIDNLYATLEDLYQARIALEVGAMEWVVQGLTDETLARLTELTEEMQTRLAAGAPIFKEDREFHNTLIRACSNPVIIQFAAIIDQYFDRMRTYRRNPYYFKVDTAGNQLPYIDELRAVRVADTEAQLLKTIAGELDWSSLGFNGGVANMPLIIQNQESGDYRLAYGTWMPNAFCNIMFNFNHPDPARKELYNDVRFRQALSVAINREEMIRLVWKGAVFPSQVAPLYGPPYHGESDLFKSYAQFDPDLANQLLDEIGLTERDSQGYRLGLDGEELLLVISANTAWPPETPEVMELVRGYWEQVGINATVHPEAGDLWTARHNAGEHDLSARGAHFGGGPVHPTLNGNTFALGGWQWAPEWALWMDTQGEQGVEPPDDVKRIRELRELVLGEPDEAKRVEMVMEVFQIHMDNLWSIGIVVDDPKINQQTIITNRVRNVPTWTAGEWYPNVPASWFINE